MTAPQVTVRTSGAAETRAVAAAVASVLRVGDLVALSGDLGAGKTCFVQGAAAALGVEGRVTSPSFTIMRSYRGRLRVVHVDVYRLDRVRDVLELGEEALAEPDAVTFVEWGDAVTTLLPPDRLDVTIETAGDDDERVLEFATNGAWMERASALRAALAPWIRLDAAPAAH